MAWRRLGRLQLDVGDAPWARSHAALPVVDQVDDDRFEVYLSLRDAEGRARIGRTALAMSASPTLHPLEAEPILDLGPLGAFDYSGVTSSCLAHAPDGRRLLFYTGWMRGVTVPFYLAAGLAVGDGSIFRRFSPAPVLERDAVDPFLTASPFVLAERDRWRMWYVSATHWQSGTERPRHHYHIRYAESHDGFAWRRDGTVCIDFASPDEYAFARPCVVHDDRYRMWYAVRGGCYRIGYAESSDGIAWSRHDATGGLLPGDTGWDSGMVEYPYVFHWRGRRYMLYNGNDYGRTGVGLAVQER